MNQHPAQQMFNEAEKLLKGARVPEQFQAAAQDAVERTRDLYARSAAAAQDGTKLLTEVAETAWANTKLLNDKLLSNVASNAEAAFDFSAAVAKAQSLTDIARLQSEFLQALSANANAQAKEFLDLSARATQHLIETMQSAVGKSMKL
jgi:hypothetical protein